ncbi:MAG TPA: winged helix-turn-helix domain-containing protein [Vicinamibacterales bacterium]|nr:winged helix-turn-helix domain-containing protein [Vicinamibacterales bacterium]
MPASPLYAFGPFSLDPDRRVVTRAGEPLPVTARAFDVLLALVERAGQTVEKDELLRLVWPDTVVEEANLSQQIFTIRKLLGQTDEQPYIATVPRRGYRFVATVARMPQSETTTEGPEAAPARREPLMTCTEAIRLAVPLDGTRLALGPCPSVAIAPDGSRLVFVAGEGGSTRLYLRPLDRFEAVAIPGTEGASNPFFSPDGRWIGFQAARQLRKVPIDGGPPLAVCEVADLRGAAWTADDEIVFAPGPTTGLWRAPASGGPPTPLTTLRFEAGERTHRWPHALPDSRRVLFTIGGAGATSFDEAALAVADLATGEYRLVLRHASDGRYAPAGTLVWARGAALFAAAFDPQGSRVDGSARVVLNGVAMSATGAAHFACSSTGVLVHVPGEAQSLRRSLVAVDRQGRELARYTGGESLEEPRFAPDGRSAIVSLRGRSSDLWLYEFSRGALERLTYEGENFAAIWGPDEGTITFSSSRGGPSDLYLLRADRAGEPELLVASEFDKVAGAWSPDGTALIFAEYHPESGADLWVVDRTTERARPFVRTRFNEYSPIFSPDGRFVAYATDASGRPEIVLVSYPDATGKRQISTDGGTEPVWSRDGSELFYRSGDRMMRVDMSRGAAEPGIPTTLFEGRYVPGTVTLANYDISADADRFLMVVADDPPVPTAIRVTIGWRAE